MKLYTEEEIRRTFGFGLNEIHFKGFMNAMTPILLPSGEEIDDYAMTEAKIKEADFNDTTMGLLAYVEFKIGAKWVIEQIEKQK